MALIGQGASERVFENNGHIYEYCPGAEADNPRGVTFIFVNINFQSIWSSVVFPMNDVLTVLLIQIHRRYCFKKGQE